MGNTGIFAAIVLGFSLIIGRRLAWWLCRNHLYTTRSNAVAIFGCFWWGLLLAVALRFLIVEFQPHWAVKWFLGYGIGTYLAFVNYGLFQESTIPPEAQGRHAIIETVPVITFIVASIALAWIPRPGLTQ
jgi:hypothetical protein